MTLGNVQKNLQLRGQNYKGFILRTIKRILISLFLKSLFLNFLFTIVFIELFRREKKDKNIRILKFSPNDVLIY